MKKNYHEAILTVQVDPNFLAVFFSYEFDLYAGIYGNYLLVSSDFCKCLLPSLVLKITLHNFVS